MMRETRTLIALIVVWLEAVAAVSALDGLPFEARNLGLEILQGPIMASSGFAVFTADEDPAPDRVAESSVRAYDFQTQEIVDTGLHGWSSHVVDGRWIIIEGCRELTEGTGTCFYDFQTRQAGALRTPDPGQPTFGGVAKWLWPFSISFIREFDGLDLNGDGDREDWFILITNRLTGDHSIWEFPRYGAYLTQRWLILNQWEWAEGTDWNDDGDLADSRATVVDLSSGSSFAVEGFAGAAAEGHALIQMDESGVDLNGNGRLGDTVLHVLDLETQALQSLGISGFLFVDRFRHLSGASLIHEDRHVARIGALVVVYVEEQWTGQDANGDGDIDDACTLGVDLAAADVRLLACGDPLFNSPNFDLHNVEWLNDPEGIEDYWAIIAGRWLAFGPSSGLQVYDLATATLVNLGLRAGAGAQQPWYSSFDSWLLFPHREVGQGDYNGDGDTVDAFLIAVDLLSTRMLAVETHSWALTYHVMIGGWLFYRVGAPMEHGGTCEWEDHAGICDWGMMELEDGAIIRGLLLDGVAAAGPYVALLVQEREGDDLNGDGDVTDLRILHVAVVRPVPPATSFHRADPNQDGATDISDGITIFGFLFLGNPAILSCGESADANNDGTIDISDVISLLNWLFIGGPAPAAPGPTGMPCGIDPDPKGSPGDLGCESYNCK